MAIKGVKPQESKKKKKLPDDDKSLLQRFATTIMANTFYLVTYYSLCVEWCDIFYLSPDFVMQVFGVDW